MGFPISSGLLDAMVLSVVSRNDTYGYEFGDQKVDSILTGEGISA